MNNFLEVLLKKGYEEKGYGYTLVKGETTHWVTLFKDNQLQMYAYYTDGDPDEMGKTYDTGIVTITDVDLKNLIRIFTDNH